MNEIVLFDDFYDGDAGWQFTATPAGGTKTRDQAAPIWSRAYSEKLVTRSTTPAIGDVAYLTKGLPTIQAGRLRYELWFAEHPTVGRGFVWLIPTQVRDDGAWFDPGLRYDFVGGGGELSISRSASAGWGYDYPSRTWEVVATFNPGNNPAGSNNWHHMALDVDWIAGALVNVTFDSVLIKPADLALSASVSAAQYALLQAGVAARAAAQAGVTLGAVRVRRLPRGL